MVANRAKRPRTAAEEDGDQFEHGEVILAVEKLQELQDELEKVNEEANKKVLEIEQKYSEKRKPVYAKRNKIISSIPNFWLTAFVSHPILGEKLTQEDQKIFNYLDSLDVEDFKDFSKGYCITFNFKPNPFFENTKLTKTIKFFDEGTLRANGTTIKWKEGKGPADDINDGKNGKESFFSWFSNQPDDKVEVDQDEVAEVIKEDLWPNPIEHLNNEDDEEDTVEDEDDEGEDDEAEDEEDDEEDGSEDDN